MLLQTTETDLWGFYLRKGAISPEHLEQPCEDRALAAQWDDVASLIEEGKQRPPAPGACGPLLQLAAKGIPQSRRGRMWPLLLGATAFRQSHADVDYSALCRSPFDKSDKTTAQILLDVGRSFPEHSKVGSAEGQEAMFRVLHAYSLFNPAVGYCQGMGFLAGVLLMNTPGEEASFWSLCAMLERTADFYTPTMPGISRESAAFDALFKKYLPGVHAHIREQGCSSAMLYVVPWFIPMFTGLASWATAMRAWDLFMCEGIRALHRVGLALITLCAEDILELECNELIPFLLNPPARLLTSSDKVLAKAMRLPIDSLLDGVPVTPSSTSQVRKQRRRTPTSTRGRQHPSGPAGAAPITAGHKRTLEEPPASAPPKRRVAPAAGPARSPEPNAISPQSRLSFQEFCMSPAYDVRAPLLNPTAPTSSRPAMGQKRSASPLVGGKSREQQSTRRTNTTGRDGGPVGSPQWQPLSTKECPPPKSPVMLELVPLRREVNDEGGAVSKLDLEETTPLLDADIGPCTPLRSSVKPNARRRSSGVMM